jgi:hypothetical protein
VKILLYEDVFSPSSYSGLACSMVLWLLSGKVSLSLENISLESLGMMPWCSHGSSRIASWTEVFYLWYVATRCLIINEFCVVLWVSSFNFVLLWYKVPVKEIHP